MVYTRCSKLINEICSFLLDVHNAKPGQILISKETYERIKETFKVTPLDAIKVKGKEQFVEIYQVEGELNEKDLT